MEVNEKKLSRLITERTRLSGINRILRDEHRSRPHSLNSRSLLRRFHFSDAEQWVRLSRGHATIALSVRHGLGDSGRSLRILAALGATGYKHLYLREPVARPRPPRTVCQSRSL